MYRPGHFGVALTLYAPIAGVLVAAGLTDRAFLGAGLSLALAMLPDLDSKTIRLQHRGPTHSIPFALLVGLLSGAAAGVLAGVDGGVSVGLWFAGFGLLVGTLTIVSHLLADVLTPMGIRPFWPVSDKHFTLDITPASDPKANYLLFAGGTIIIAGAWFLGHALG
ncbi:metal-dependent hydrolase [Haladaptatus pallidirubidus]|uniref:Metal-dependent hydrolase n=1 Tax=Haladaptatus pallidirubidus TaxID=1008152 RepID=A0AAV3UDN3_9EURY|nr:metal-dependent hydrolase [Haladaptatus pallidirubidus]